MSRKHIAIIGATSAIAEHCARLWVEREPLTLTLVGRDEEKLRRIAAATGQPLRALIRTKQPEYLEQGLDNPALTDDELLAAMVATPVLINRPIVVTEKGARLGRPLQAIEQVL